MKKNEKIMLGLVAVAAVGAYLYFDNKKKKNGTENFSGVSGKKVTWNRGGLCWEATEDGNGLHNITQVPCEATVMNPNNRFGRGTLSTNEYNVHSVGSTARRMGIMPSVRSEVKSGYVGEVYVARGGAGCKKITSENPFQTEDVPCEQSLSGGNRNNFWTGKTKFTF